jgi:uncharacterized membrane protein
MTSGGYDETTEAAGWQAYDETTEATGWVGWSIFAATMMIIGGGLNALYGLVAVVNDDWVVWTNRNAAYLDLSAWGWVHIVVGVLVVLAGFGVLSGNVLARTVGVIWPGSASCPTSCSSPSIPCGRSS